MRRKESTRSTFLHTFGTAFGAVAVVWSWDHGDARINRVILSAPTQSADEVVHAQYPGAGVSTCAIVAALAGDIAAYLSGAPVEFALDTLDMAACSAFQQRVLRTEHAIPRGRVSTYGLIAAYLGMPAAARAVGTALATNPFPIIIPCHRAIRSDGTLGGYQGGLAMKHALLAMEGIRLSTPTRVAAVDFYYADSCAANQLR